MVVGESDRRHSADFALARYRRNGSLDKSFGQRGQVRTAFPLNAAATAVAVQPNGRIIVAGTIGSPRSALRQVALARYMPGGQLDKSFGRDGKVMTPLQARTVGVFLGAALAIDGNGKIFVAATDDPSGSGPSRFAVARYNANGSLDRSFGQNGLATAGFGADAAVATALAIDSHTGQLVVAGYTFDSTNYALQGFALAEYTPDGSLDSSFGSNGEVTTTVGAASAAAAVAVQSDGRIVAGGSSFTDKSLQIRHFALARYTSTGALDPSFGSDGIVTTSFNNDDDVADLTVEAHGAIVAAGSTVIRRGSSFRFALARYTRSGGLDSSFGSGGRVTTAFGAGDDQGRAVVLEPNGKLVVVGEADGLRNGASSFALARYRG